VTVPADHAAAWQAYWREVDAAAVRHRQAVAQQRSDTAGQVTIGVGLILLYFSLIAAPRHRLPVHVHRLDTDEITAGIVRDT
jgi:hypothetical protein